MIDARLAGGIEYMYGLGDYGALGNTGGSVRETSNVVGVNRTARGSFTNWNSVARFISNFSIAPQLGFAQVLFETDDKRVAITDEQTLLVMIRETCAAEATHTLLMLAGLGVIVIWPCVWGVMLYLVYAILGNLIFIIIQRYNRPRLVRLYERKRAKRSNEA